MNPQDSPPIPTESSDMDRKYKEESVKANWGEEWYKEGFKEKMSPEDN